MSGFETARVMVQVLGDHYHTVPADNITPAEYQVLQHVHGADSITFIEKTGHLVKTKMTDDGRLMVRPVSAKEHKEDLAIKYKGKYSEVYMGVNPTLPESFDKIQLVHVDAVEGDDEESWVFADAPLLVEKEKTKAKEV